MFFLAPLASEAEKTALCSPLLACSFLLLLPPLPVLAASHAQAVHSCILGLPFICIYIYCVIQSALIKTKQNKIPLLHFSVSLNAS